MTDIACFHQLGCNEHRHFCGLGRCNHSPWHLRIQMDSRIDDARICRFCDWSSESDFAAETQFAKGHPELGYRCALSQLLRREEITRLLAQDQIDNGYAFEIIGCQAQPPRSQMPRTTSPHVLYTWDYQRSVPISLAC